MVENNNTPAIQDDGQNFLSEFNLPKLLLGPAGDAISRLIGTAVDIPVAHLEQYSQRIRDKTSGNTAISQALAAKVAERAVDDPKLVERAMASFSNDILRKQGNREQVAVKALEELSGSEISVEPKKIDDDWMNTFADLSENASSALMQERWAKILAGEISSPGNFSKKTLQVVDVLPQNVANRFEEYARSLIDWDLIFSFSGAMSGLPYGDLSSFDNFGLARFSHAYKSFDFSNTPNQELYITWLQFPGGDLTLFKRNPTKIKVPGYILTPEGSQIAKILSPPDKLDIDLCKRVLKTTDVEYAIKTVDGQDLILDREGLKKHKGLVYYNKP